MAMHWQPLPFRLSSKEGTKLIQLEVAPCKDCKGCIPTQRGHALYIQAVMDPELRDPLNLAVEGERWRLIERTQRRENVEKMCFMFTGEKPVRDHVCIYTGFKG